MVVVALPRGLRGHLISPLFFASSTWTWRATRSVSLARWKSFEATWLSLRRPRWSRPLGRTRVSWSCGTLTSPRGGTPPTGAAGGTAWGRTRLFRNSPGVFSFPGPSWRPWANGSTFPSEMRRTSATKTLPVTTPTWVRGRVSPHWPIGWGERRRRIVEGQNFVRNEIFRN